MTTSAKVTARITGAADGLTDYDFRVSYYTIQKKNATPSYYYLTAPYSVELLDALTSRPGGTIRLLDSGVEFEYFNQDDVSYSVGPNSSSITISGERQETNASPVAVSFPQSVVIVDRLDTLGRPVLTVVPYAVTMRPEDTTIWRGTSYKIGTISYQMGVTPRVVVTLEEP